MLASKFNVRKINPGAPQMRHLRSQTRAPAHMVGSGVDTSGPVSTPEVARPPEDGRATVHIYVIGRCLALDLRYG